MKKTVLFTLGLCAFSVCAENALFNDVAIKVNNQNVSVRDVEALYHDSYVLIQDKLRRRELTASTLDSAVRLAWADALDNAIQDKLLDQRADKRRRDIINYYLQAAGPSLGGEKAMAMFQRMLGDNLRRFRAQTIQASGGEEELGKALKKRGQTWKQWDENLAKELFRRDVISMELGPVVVKPSEVKEFYDKNPEKFGQPESWRLRRIRIPKEKFSSPEVALEAARLTKRKIEKEGAAFEEIAAKISDDNEHGLRGGLMMRDGNTDQPTGTFPFEERVAADLKDGQISEPVGVSAWYVIVQRLGHTDAHLLPYDKSSDKAEGLVYMEKIKEKKKEMYEKLKRESFVEILQKDPPEHLLKPQQ